jgi:hypothetical protein
MQVYTHINIHSTRTRTHTHAHTQIPSTSNMEVRRAAPLPCSTAAGTMLPPPSAAYTVCCCGGGRDSCGGGRACCGEGRGGVSSSSPKNPTATAGACATWGGAAAATAAIRGSWAWILWGCLRSKASCCALRSANRSSAASICVCVCVCV